MRNRQPATRMTPRIPAFVLLEARRMAAETTATLPEPITDPVESAKAARLRYVSDRKPGIRRKRVGRNFSYIGLDGKPIRDPKELHRIKALAIPPAWTDVWICPFRNGHIQATARDAKGRKQYRYHPRWREVRDETKYSRMIAFGKALPRIRERTERDLKLPGLPREKVLSTVVRLLEETLIRVGNAEYARQNKSFGLTTMRDKHVKIEDTNVHFEFKGKSGKKHIIDVENETLAEIVKRCRDLPGYEIFQYFDENGERQDVDAGDVNDYLREITGEDFSAKDFRTWAGTVIASLLLQERAVFDSETQAKKNLVEAIEQVAEKLGNTPAICRKCYIHPAVIDSYLEGSLLDTLQQRVEQEIAEGLEKLEPEEAAVLTLLQQRLEREEEQDAARR